MGAGTGQRVVVSETSVEPEWSSSLEQRLASAALGAGFSIAGVAPVDNPGSVMEQRDGDRFTQWLDLGRAGDMEYLKRRDEAGQLLRNSVQVAMPWARSVILCAFNYNAPHPRSIDAAPRDRAWIARYAWGGTPATNAASIDSGDRPLLPADYHNELLRRLHALDTDLRDRISCATRCYVDTGPMVERTLAARAGVGWIGKNTCVLNQQRGSWLLLGAIATSLRLPTARIPALAVDRCGSCTRCLDACPTGALVAPREMDATRCIAYLTIEKKGSIPEPLRAPMGRQVFGCDICQDVCPWNRDAPTGDDPRFRPRPELVNPPLAVLAGMDAPAFRRAFRGSPLERTGLKRLRRNVAIAMGNSGDAQHTATLERWSLSEDPVLAETAAWALGRLTQAAPPDPAFQDPEPLAAELL